MFLRIQLSMYLIYNKNNNLFACLLFQEFNVCSHSLNVFCSILMCTIFIQVNIDIVKEKILV